MFLPGAQHLYIFSESGQFHTEIFSRRPVFYYFFFEILKCRPINDFESGAAAVEVKETCGSQTLCINPPPGGGDQGDIGGTRI